MRHIINTGNGCAVQAQTLPAQGLVAITSMNRNNIKNGDVFHTAYLTPAEVGALIASLQMCGEHVEKWDSFLPSDLEADQAERVAA